MSFLKKSKITITAGRQKNNVVISVKDTGIGVSENDMPKLFTKFFQADSGLDRRHEGTGLGLFIVKKIIEAHGGRERARHSASSCP